MDPINDVRRFNRFYTKQIGLLQDGFLQSPYSLAEVRVLSELFRREGATSVELCRELDLDPGYVSRMIKKFEKEGLVERQRMADDGRQQSITLTSAGHDTFKPLNDLQHAQVAAIVTALSEQAQLQLVRSMQTIEQLLDSGAAGAIAGNEVIIRNHQPGDMGWVVYQHARIYTDEYGWNSEFEALVARIVAEFLEKFDPQWERCLIAEQNNKVVGSIFIVRKSKTIAQLRLFFVDACARGQGVGKRLLADCVEFARQCGYRSVVLWTQANLIAARHLYEQAGFIKTSEEPHHSFGADLIAETWELGLN